MSEQTIDLIINSQQSTYDVPTDGSHQALLLDIEFMNNVETAWGLKDKAKFIWQVTEDGKVMQVHQRLNRSLHEKSSLRKMLKTWLRRDPGLSYNLTPLKGGRATLVTERVEYEGRTYANVIAALPAHDGK